MSKEAEVRVIDSNLKQHREKAHEDDLAFNNSWREDEQPLSLINSGVEGRESLSYIPTLNSLVVLRTKTSKSMPGRMKSPLYLSSRAHFDEGVYELFTR